MIRTVGGKPLADTGSGTIAPGSITAIVPTLNEEHRLAPALAALARSGPEVAAIVVVDGGSTDRTAEVVAAAVSVDARISFHAAPPTPAGWNGKAWNLEVGLGLTATPWFASVDADVRVGAGTLVAAAARCAVDDLAALSVATRQEVADLGAALLHPALLTTLVYRAGLPNVIANEPRGVQANGQVFVARRDVLAATDALRTARASRCEDVTTARALAAAGSRVGFFEGDATVRMHDSWYDCAANWPRSLTLSDGFVSRTRTWFALAEVACAQALPLPLLIVSFALHATLATPIFFALVMMRFGVLAGTRRAYVNAPVAYWFSPLVDVPAVGLLAASMLRKRHVWRGRTLVLRQAQHDRSDA
jgi:dolichol-phosphate mannosyltransferase